MNAIKASSLSAAVSMTAALMLNDGKFEQWQKLFSKALNDATDVKWKDKGWTESQQRSTSKSKTTVTVHSLTFTSKAGNLILNFSETATGYQFFNGYLETPAGDTVWMRDPSATSYQGTPINNGGDILDLVGKNLSARPSSTKPVAPASKGPLTTQAKVLQALKAKFGYEFVKFSRGSAQGRTVKRGGETFKAIPTGVGHSPVDVTSIGANKVAAKFAEVVAFVKDMDGVKTTLADRDLAAFQFNVGTPKLFTLALSPQRFGAYQASDNMDPGYTNSYITVHMRDGD